MVGDYIPHRSMEIERPNSFRARTPTGHIDRQKKGNDPGSKLLLRVARHAPDFRDFSVGFAGID
jgi:hypothetical protein